VYKRQVQVEYVFLMDNEVIEIDSSDTYGQMEVRTASKAGIVMTNEENPIDLDTDSKEHIMGNMYFVIADNDDADTVLRFYPMVEVTTGGDCPVPEPCPVVNVTPCEPCPTVTPEVVKEYVNVTVPGNVTLKFVEPSEGEGTNTLPGFEAFMAMIGLLVVMWLIVRQR